MKTCSTCKYYEARFPDNKPEEQNFLCSRGGSENGVPVDPGFGACAQDYQYRAFLVVSPDFGCIKHEEKPK